MPTSGERHLRLVAEVTLAALVLTGCSGVRVGYISKSAQPKPKASLQHGHVGLPTGLANGELPDPITGAAANEMVRAMWAHHEAARMADDDAASLALDVQPELTNEQARQAHFACCYHGYPPKALALDESVVLLGPGPKPAHMIAIVETHAAANAAQRYESQMVLVRRPGNRWRIAMVSIGATRPGLRSTNKGAIPRITTRQGAQLLADFGDNLESWFETGRPTDSHVWSGQSDELGQDQRSASLRVNSYSIGHITLGVPDPSRVWLVRTPAGTDLVCGVLTGEGSNAALPGKALRQDSERLNWGDFVAPGQYLSVTEHMQYAACLQTSDGGGHLDVIGLDWTSLSGDGVRAA